MFMCCFTGLFNCCLLLFMTYGFMFDFVCALYVYRELFANWTLRLSQDIRNGRR